MKKDDVSACCSGTDHPADGDCAAGDAEVPPGEDCFRALFDSAPDAIFVENLEGRVLDVNPAGCRLHGMTREELIGLSVVDLVPPANRAEAMENFGRLATGEKDQIEGYSYRSDGRSVAVSIRSSRFQYSGRDALLFHVRNITERRLLEERLRQSQKMEAIGRLAGGVAHDFNNLLTGILGYTELCRGTLEPEHEAQEDLVQIQRAGEKAARLVRQLLAFSRQQVLEPKVLDLNEVVVNIEKLCRRTLGEDVALATQLSPKLKSVRADEGQLEQVILNLAVNSRDAMPDGGAILIKTQNVSFDADSSRQQVTVAQGEYVALSVTDSGCGMEPEVRDRAFDPFFTTKGPDKGTGLGLSTVYGIVKQSGGYVWMDSEPGSGSSVYILLPASEEAVGHDPPAASRAAVFEKGKSVLLTEDNQVVRDLSKKALEDRGYRVVAAASGEEALSICERTPEDFDLLVTDVVLTGMDGVRLAREILARKPETRVLLVSGHSDRARFSQEGLLDGASFLQKPFAPTDLERAVAEALSEAS